MALSVQNSIELFMFSWIWMYYQKSSRQWRDRCSFVPIRMDCDMMAVDIPLMEGKLLIQMNSEYTISMMITNASLFCCHLSAL